MQVSKSHRVLNCGNLTYTISFRLYVFFAVFLCCKSLECEYNKVYKTELQHPCGEQMKLTAPAKFDVIFGSNYGDFTAHCVRDRAPVWMDRIYNLVLNGYYNENYFFRVIDDFVAQFGTNGDPSVSNVYNWNSSDLKPCSILSPQPDEMPVNTNGIHGLSNLFGTLSMSTSYNETTGTTWNATAELFINLANNSRLDSMVFVPLCTIDMKDMHQVVLRFPSYGEVEELGGPGPSLTQLYAEGNAYIEANESWSAMAETSVVRVSCPCSLHTHINDVCGPCARNLRLSPDNNASALRSGERQVMYGYFSTVDRKWYCPEIYSNDTCSP